MTCHSRGTGNGGDSPTPVPKCATSIERVRRMRGAVACYPCCRQHSGGEFDGRFRLVEREM